MAIRAVATEIQISKEDWSWPPVYSFQNYFKEPKDFFGIGVSSPYNAFSITPFSYSRDAVTVAFTVNFAGTEANVKLVEECINNRYRVTAVIYRWSSVEGLDEPSSFNILGAVVGDAVGGSTDFTSAELKVSSYANTVGGDFPGRVMPWQILAPLSTRVK